MGLETASALRDNLRITASLEILLKYCGWCPEVPDERVIVDSVVCFKFLPRK
jgi:hypothetical protein